MGKKNQIKDAINTYIGNYCYRKCFKRESLMSNCFEQFDELIKKLGDTPISRKEFNLLMKKSSDPRDIFNKMEDMLKEYSEKARSSLRKIPDSDAKINLENLIKFTSFKA